MIVSLTGHRPRNLPTDRHFKPSALKNLEIQLTALAEMPQNASSGDVGAQLTTIVIRSGFALGWDLWGAALSVQLGIPLHAILPCDRDHQVRLWNPQAREEYYRLLELASWVSVVSPGPYTDGCMQKRNETLILGGTAVETTTRGTTFVLGAPVQVIDLPPCDAVAALWDGRREGGTYHTVCFAESSGIPVHNCWPKAVPLNSPVRT